MILIFLIKTSVSTFFLYKRPYLIDSKWCVSDYYTCTIIKQGRAMFNTTDLSLHSSRSYWTTLLFSIRVLFLQQQIKIITTVNSLGSYYIPDTVLSNLKVLPHLILTPRQWVASPSSHFTDRQTVRSPGTCLPYMLSKRRRQHLNWDNCLKCASG